MIFNKNYRKSINIRFLEEKKVFDLILIDNLKENNLLFYNFRIFFFLTSKKLIKFEKSYFKI